ncbi:MAG: RNA 2',3'-cyclic phosphodiesterase [Opitutus sp.]
MAASDVITERLFIALSLPDAVKTVVAGLTTPLHDVRWTPVEKLHVTVRFLGDISVESRDELVERLASVRVDSFPLPLESGGVFPTKGPPRVLWVGVGSGHPRLYQLRQQIDDTLLAAGLPTEIRTFHPHVTVGRCTELASAAVNAWVRTHRNFAGPTFMVEAFDLFATTLHPAGAIYRLVRRYLLKS